jgi:hypothetical protein
VPFGTGTSLDAGFAGDTTYSSEPVPIFQAGGEKMGTGTSLDAGFAGDTTYSSEPVPIFPISQAELRPIVAEAIARWSRAGLDDAAVAKLSQVEVLISDLPGSYLGQAERDRVYIDRDAAGYGWFVDDTPGADEEFALSGEKMGTSTSPDAGFTGDTYGSEPVPVFSGGRLQAVDSRAVDRIDLLSVVEHELGHIAGFDDLDDAMAGGVMSGSLGVGVRRNV